MTDPITYQPPKVRIAATYHAEGSAHPESVEVELNNDAFDRDLILALVGVLLQDVRPGDQLRIRVNDAAAATTSNDSTYLRNMEVRAT